MPKMPIIAKRSSIIQPGQEVKVLVGQRLAICKGANILPRRSLKMHCSPMAQENGWLSKKIVNIMRTVY